jgi:hypothetical protein
MVAALKSEWVAAFKSAYPAGFVGIRNHAHPWGWRIKIPLSGIGWAEIRAAEKPGKCLVANVLGRRPHTTDAIKWRVGAFYNS